MAARQTRVFVPWEEPYDNDDWCETLLGRVIKPLVDEHPSLEWFWFSRYRQRRAGSSEDCCLGKIPPEFERATLWRSVRFRFDIPETDRGRFEREGTVRIREKGCAISDWREFDTVSDLGGNRFLGGKRCQSRQIERSELVTSFLQAISKLVLHALVGPDDEGRFRVERNDHDQNPLGSSFQSLHHMFCNISNIIAAMSRVR